MIILITIAVLIVTLLLRSAYECRHFMIKTYDIKSEKMGNEKLSFAFMSDLHNCTYGEKNERLMTALRESGCEFLVIGGDMIKGKRNVKNEDTEKYFKNATDFLSQATKEMKVFYVFGNHETRVKERRKENTLFDSYMKSIEEMNICFLNDKREEIGKNAEIAGLEISEKEYKEDTFKLVNTEKFSSREKYNILVAHIPEYFKEYEKTKADLVLCGHNHGGTIRLPLAGGVISRRYKLFPEYSYGIYEYGQSKMILTSGLGDHSIHFRLFNMPELVIVNIFGECN